MIPSHVAPSQGHCYHFVLVQYIRLRFNNSKTLFTKGKDHTMPSTTYMRLDCDRFKTPSKWSQSWWHHTELTKMIFLLILALRDFPTLLKNKRPESHQTPWLGHVPFALWNACLCYHGTGCTVVRQLIGSQNETEDIKRKVRLQNASFCCLCPHGTRSEVCLMIPELILCWNMLWKCVGFFFLLFNSFFFPILYPFLFFVSGWGIYMILLF